MQQPTQPVLVIRRSNQFDLEVTSRSHHFDDMTRIHFQIRLCHSKSSSPVQPYNGFLPSRKDTQPRQLPDRYQPYDMGFR